MTKNTVRKYYALHLKSGVATVVAFNKKRDRDKYVDHWHGAESIPASIAHKLIKQIGVEYYNSEV